MVYERDETIKQLNYRLIEQEDKRPGKNIKQGNPLVGFDHFDSMKEKIDRLE